MYVGLASSFNFTLWSLEMCGDRLSSTAVFNSVTMLFGALSLSLSHTYTFTQGACESLKTKMVPVCAQHTVSRR